MKNSIIIILALAVMSVFALVAALVVDWTPKEDELKAYETSYDDELQQAKSGTEQEVDQGLPDNGILSNEVQTGTDEIGSELTEEGTPEDDFEVSDQSEKTFDGSTAEIKENDGDSDVLPASADSVENSVKDEWVQSKIDDHRSEIDDLDLALGSEIYNQLDTLYLLDLADEGLTEDEEAEVKAYLKSELSEDEVATAWELYNKYVHMLNE